MDSDDAPGPRGGGRVQRARTNVDDRTDVAPPSVEHRADEAPARKRRRKPSRDDIVVEQDEGTIETRDAEQDFRKHVTDAYLKNKWSAKDTVLTVSKATRAGSGGVKDLSRAGGGGGK